ncbi:hypothetical protein DY052_06375 [Apilactobacillus timberlakei]|uniref:hypothetical protein n=1 Tax=Apilactobacillus timberlakei TaxID=2008380 RepID=UPI00112C173C|nr:hypothetical protein [Apilactobacillus timberlakei]TPR15050.1 hypothetical protein DY052_06375 [Apilactobacillus timberlakei]
MNSMESIYNTRIALDKAFHLPSNNHNLIIRKIKNKNGELILKAKYQTFIIIMNIGEYFANAVIFKELPFNNIKKSKISAKSEKELLSKIIKEVQKIK